MKVRNGEPIVLVLKVESGEMNTVTAVSAKIKRAAPGRQVPLASVASLATFTVAADNAIPGWRLTIANSSSLGIGDYVVDAALTVTGYGTLYTDPIFLSIIGKVTD